MEVYIVRIYRREDGDPRIIAGTVEEPGGRSKKHFPISMNFVTS